MNIILLVVLLQGLKTCCHGDRCTSALFLQSRSKHYNPKYKKEREEKTRKVSKNTKTH